MQVEKKRGVAKLVVQKNNGDRDISEGKKDQKRPKTKRPKIEQFSGCMYYLNLCCLFQLTMIHVQYIKSIIFPII